ncbi:nucleotide-binding protein [Bradyrhizobium ivorense]|uniref:nucleotide-binding protein n=1 Tax=Bradyrhizobium ivorense TaxID=2511166 RepID=UPI001E343738|nr:P-loop NTPase [Bradyrhizobium ivorense]
MSQDNSPTSRSRSPRRQRQSPPLPPPPAEAPELASSQPQSQPPAASEGVLSPSTPLAATTTNSSDPVRSITVMKNVHFTLQGKGGVGKSLVSSLIAQYLRDKGEAVTVVDTDPVNATLAGYKAFGTQRLELMENGSLVERNFDQLMEQVIEQDTHFVIDNGAASFIPLSYYIAENDAINVIGDHGKQVVIHTVITGGQAIRDTLAGFNALAEQMPGNAQIIVWLNEFFGDIEAEGKTFEEMKVYQNHKDRVRGLIRIPRQTGSTFGKDVQLMLDNKLTFDEVAQSPTFGLMAKSRLAQVRKTIFDQLAILY